MSDLVEFLRARLDEDEAVASAASAGPWGVYKGRPGIRGMERLSHGVTLPGEGSGSLVSIAAHSWLDAEHIARHDPARVLARVKAHRRLIERYERAVAVGESVSGYVRGQDDGYRQACLDAIRDAAETYADHPDYRQEWSV